jgi:uncharacterized membrane protein YeaQ/YmgE (transglycosylase-associated protein family)
MMNLIVFAVIGLLAGASARMLYPRRQPMHILGTMALGAIGGVLGGVISWSNWPEVENQFQAGNLVVSILGALVVITVGASVSYARGISGYRNTTH